MSPSPEQAEVVVVVGTRPEIIKMAPVLRAMESEASLRTHLVHTGQHYDENLSETFFDTLGLSAPDRNLGVKSGSHGAQTAAGLSAIERLLVEREPPVVLAQGDTNAVLSTAIAASKLPVAFGHVEAGIRSWDRSMPEEVNRVLADAVADLAFAPTEAASENLADEAAVADVVVTGNTVVDACLEHVAIAERESAVLSELELSAGGYALATIHRPRNTDDPDRLRAIVEALDAGPYPVVFPAHPRTRGALEALGIEPAGSLRLLEPLDYLPFLKLLSNARAVVTDSGGIQEEASVLEVPCLTVRPNTERPETVDAGVNRLVEPSAVAAELHRLFEDDDRYSSMRGAPHLYGDGDAGERIVSVLADRFGRQ